MIPVPRGHPWSCPTCTVEVRLTAQGGGLTVEIGHEGGCATWRARLRALAPELELSSAMTVRPAGATDLDAVEALSPRW